MFLCITVTFYSLHPWSAFALCTICFVFSYLIFPHLFMLVSNSRALLVSLVILAQRVRLDPEWVSLRNINLLGFGGLPSIITLKVTLLVVLSNNILLMSRDTTVYTQNRYLPVFKVTLGTDVYCSSCIWSNTQMPTNWVNSSLHDSILNTCKQSKLLQFLVWSEALIHTAVNKQDSLAWFSGIGCVLCHNWSRTIWFGSVCLIKEVGKWYYSWSILLQGQDGAKGERGEDGEAGESVSQKTTGHIWVKVE